LYVNLLLNQYNKNGGVKMHKTKTEKEAKAVEKAEIKHEKEVKAAEKTESKNAAKIKKLKPDFYVEFQGQQISEESIINKFITEWEKDKKLSAVKTLSIYFKPEEGTAYVVVNGEETVAVPVK
jgi:hypothetical protein